jgi:hypothetical protein
MNRLHFAMLLRPPVKQTKHCHRCAVVVATLGTLLVVSAAPSRADIIYFSDTTATVEKLNNFVVSPFATLPSGQAEGIAVNAAGDVFVASSTGTIYKYAGGNPASASTFATVGGVLSGLALDNSGNLFVANRSSGQVDKITAGGNVSQFTTGTPFLLPSGLAISGGNLYVADHSTDAITKVALSNASESMFVTIPGGPFGLAADSMALFDSRSQTTDQVLSIPFANPIPMPLVNFLGSAAGGGLATDGLGHLFMGKIGGMGGSQLLEESTTGGVPMILANLQSDPNFLALAPATVSTPEPASLTLCCGAAVSFLCFRVLRARRSPARASFARAKEE